ncbi:MAG: phage tail sheath family protein [Deltaproteobacteria bacterium]|nr:MAG: phage tail sheath family protein [Deltaproteobacteria bacterium]
MRGDITGILAVIPQTRWPQGGGRGDLLELPLESWAEFQRHPARSLFDPATRRAIQAFFENGGIEARLLGLCLESSRELFDVTPMTPGFDSLLDRLRGEEDIGLLIMPVLAYLPYITLPDGRTRCGSESMIHMLLEHCREMNNRFLILDAPQHLHDRELRRWVRSFRQQRPELMSFGAIYYPWLKAGDEVFPPSGSIAGVFAKLEKEHEPWGVHWPPANESIRGVTHTNVELEYSETEDLTSTGINPIMIQPGRGVVVWGARTMSKDSRWIHINSRRIVSVISEQLRRDSAWAVFENQSHELWKILERTVRHRMDAMWGGGLLTGPRAGEEYLIQCDEETNPPDVRETGMVQVKITLRPIGTTEYIVVELRLGAEAGVVVTS